jgi:hypothetical protein
MPYDLQSSMNTRRNRQVGIPKFRLDFSSFDNLYRSFCLKSLPTNGHSNFASHLALQLPEVANRIDYDDFGFMHLEVGVLTLATREAISSHDWYAVAKYFSFVSDTLEDAGAELRDALCVSYLGNLFYSEMSLDFVKARFMLPPMLAIALEKVERHYEDLLP